MRRIELLKKQIEDMVKSSSMKHSNRWANQSLSWIWNQWTIQEIKKTRKSGRRVSLLSPIGLDHELGSSQIPNTAVVLTIKPNTNTIQTALVPSFCFIYYKYKFKGNNDFSHFLLLQVKVGRKDNRYKTKSCLSQMNIVNWFTWLIDDKQSLSRPSSRWISLLSHVQFLKDQK